MRAKKLTRHLTELSEIKSPSSNRITQFGQLSRFNPRIFHEKNLNINFKTQNDPTQKNTTRESKKTITTQRNMRNNTQAIQSISRVYKNQSNDYAMLSYKEIDRNKKYNSQKRRKEVADLLAQTFKICERINDELYSYQNVEAYFKMLHAIVKQLGSITLIYRTYAFAGLCLFQYGSYSLALYYFDRALKGYYEKEVSGYKLFEKNLELIIYKFIAKIFLSKFKYEDAKSFAYKYLRKCWIVKNVDEELAAYDLLGKIFLETEQIAMSRYFHHRMCSGQKENQDIVFMSKQEMIKNERERVEYVCYETINIFVQKDTRFNEMLENHYKVSCVEFNEKNGFIESNHLRQTFMYTHRSPNRMLNNYRILERKMIEEKSSKQLHFIKASDSYRLKALFSEFSGIIFDIRRRYDKSRILPSEAYLQLQDQDSNSKEN